MPAVMGALQDKSVSSACQGILTLICRGLKKMGGLAGGGSTGTQDADPARAI